jgi:hypothetical protein
MDQAEAEHRATERTLAIQRAKKMLHDESDQVKALHGSLLQAEVMAQNAALVAHKGRVREMRAAQDAAFAEQQRRALEVGGEHMVLDQRSGARLGRPARGSRASRGRPCPVLWPPARIDLPSPAPANTQAAAALLERAPTRGLARHLSPCCQQCCRHGNGPRPHPCARPLSPQAAEEVEVAKLEADRARLLAQRDVQLRQLEDLKTRIRAERWGTAGRLADGANACILSPAGAAAAPSTRRRERAGRGTARRGASR